MNSIEPVLNRVVHADCLNVLPILPSESVDLVCTDPPYLVKYHPRDGRRCPGDDSDYWLEPSFREMYRVLRPDSFCVSFYGWPSIERFMAVWKRCGFRPVSHLVWIKSHCSRRGYTEGFHEVGFLLAKGKPPKPRFPIRDVLTSRYTGNKFHTNEKPVMGLVPLIDAYSKPANIILDPFGGSGTTAVAARACGRQFILIEKVFANVQIAQKRLGQPSA